MKKIRFASLVMVLLAASVTSATTRLVPDDYPTIQAAIDDCNHGDTVVVDRGRYKEKIDFFGKAITVRSSNPEDRKVVERTIINAGGFGSGVTFANGEDSWSRLAGFTITNGHAEHGGGVYCGNTAPTIANCIIKGNFAQHGGGLYGCKGTISKCTIADNRARRSGGGLSQCEGLINYSTINNNKAGGGGGGLCVFEGSTTISNCTITGNSASCAGGVYLVKGGTLINNTFVGNRGHPGGNILAKGRRLILNNIICNSLEGGGIRAREYDSEKGDIIAYNNVWNNARGNYAEMQDLTGINGNTSEDPLFAKPAAGDYRLQATSPCINAGDPDFALQPVRIGVDGDMRVVAGRVDIGAHEYLSPSSQAAVRRGGRAAADANVQTQSLRSLYEKLEDAQYAGNRGDIARKICLVDKDGSSVGRLVDYIRRREDWTTGKTAENISRLTGKVGTLQWIGLIGGKQVDALLSKALTDAGAEELARDWIDGPLPEPFNRDGVLKAIRGSAAKGIVLEQDKKNIKLVERIYRKLHDDCRKKRIVDELYYHLVEAMAVRDIIAEKGMEEYLNLTGVQEDELAPYVRRYAWEWQEKTRKARVPVEVRKQARRLFGKKVLRTRGRDVSALVRALCEPYRFYNVTILKESPFAGHGGERTYPMACGRRAFKLSSAKEVAAFLTSLKKPVNSEVEAVERARVLAELIGRTVQTQMPKRKSLIEDFMELKPEDWQVVVSDTDSGWLVSVTLMKDPYPGNENCLRYALKVSKDGEISIASEKLVYQYAALQ